MPDAPGRVVFLNSTCPAAGGPSNQSGASAGGTGWQAAAIAGYAAAAAAGGGGDALPLWLGEGGPHNGGGGGPYSASFVDAFYYLDALGALARLGHAAFARQTLVGGNYELLRCSTGRLGAAQGGAPGGACDFEPRADYYVARLWREHMGPVALAPVLSEEDDGGAAGGAARGAACPGPWAAPRADVGRYGARADGGRGRSTACCCAFARRCWRCASRSRAAADRSSPPRGVYAPPDGLAPCAAEARAAACAAPTG